MPSLIEFMLPGDLGLAVKPVPHPMVPVRQDEKGSGSQGRAWRVIQPFRGLLGTGPPGCA